VRKASLLVLFATLIAACPKSPTATGGSATTSGSGGSAGTGGAHKDGGTDAPPDAPPDVHLPPPPDSGLVHPCNLPGSVQFTASGTVTVPGGNPSWPSLGFLKLPMGFCAHYYGSVGDARQLRFAPGGELFVASPTAGTTGGGQGGLAAIVVLPDYDLDGVADATVTFQAGLTNTQGLLFANDHFYYQDHTKIMRLPYAKGDLKPSGPADVVADITYYMPPLHWPKTLDVADDGSIYVGVGGEQSDVCTVPHPFWGGIRKIDPTPGPNLDGAPIAQGFRNPIAVRCARGHNQCFALELALDYSPGSGGREKMVPIRAGDDWGYPCCATKNVAYAGVPANTDCSGVAQEGNSFFIGDTPFGVDFEPGVWPGMWNGRAYVVTHGAFGSWVGARMVAIPMDPSTGLPMPSSNVISGSSSPGPDVGMVDFVTGWDDGSQGHGRPAAVTFSSDGRLFVGNDNDGTIFWIAPLGM
jgi:glucose/arabinose dehydrogenase